MMTDNYRSTPEIIAAVNSLIDKNTQRTKKSLVSKRTPGTKPVCYHALNQQKEAQWICEKINELNASGVPLGDIAVLYRAHYITRNIEEAMLKGKMPYKIYSGIQFFDRAEIKDTLSYLRMIAYKDDLSFKRIINVPKRNMGQRRLSFLEEAAEKAHCSLYQALVSNLDNEIFKGTKAAAFIKLIEDFTKLSEGMQISELFSKITDASGYEKMLRTEGAQDRLDNLAELKQSIYEFETSCGEETELSYYLEHVALFTNADEPDAKDKVKLMTVHAAKGLEFPYVFLCSLNEDIFPSKKTASLAAMEEERRLAFVAMTRAEDMLFLSEPEGRTLDGSPRYPSRFILEIDQDLIDYENAPSEMLVKGAMSSIAFRQKYMPENIDSLIMPEGTRVKHDIFGTGTVTGFDKNENAHIIKFDSLDTDRKLNIRAKLERI